MRADDTRRTPDPACPDCGARPMRNPLFRHPDRLSPMITHDPTCPLGRGSDDVDADDTRWCAANPGLTRVRPLHWSEASQLAAMGRPMTRNLRRRVEVHVTSVGPGRLLRQVVLDGMTCMISTAIVDVERTR